MPGRLARIRRSNRAPAVWVLPRRRLGLALGTTWSVLSATLAAGAQQADQRFFHVTHDTYGCTNPRATLAITNHDDPRQRDPGWVAFVIADGHCAPITPRSPWRVVSMQGELAYMTYAGATGLPGSFYLRTSDLAELAPVAAPLPAYTPPPAYSAPESLPEPQATVPSAPSPSASPPPRRDAVTSGYINPPEAAPPAASYPRVPPPVPVKPAQERPAVPQPVVREQPHSAAQAATVSISARDMDDGRLAGAALAAFIVLACGFKWMRTNLAKPADGGARRKPGA